jgi:hypothetical protein
VKQPRRKEGPLPANKLLRKKLPTGPEGSVSKDRPKPGKKGGMDQKKEAS